MNNKISINPFPLLHPSPIVVVSTIVEDKNNFMTIGDIAVAGLNPPLIMISINANHQSMKAINQKVPFGINVLEMNDVSKVDYAGVFSMARRDKSDLFDSILVDHVPIIDSAPISLIVEEHSRMQVEHRVILVCKVIKTLVKRTLIQEGKITLEGLHPILYGLDNNYYDIGKVVAKGYHSK